MDEIDDYCIYYEDDMYEEDDEDDLLSKYEDLSGKGTSTMKQVNRKDLLNGWLKYHNTTVEDVIKNHPKEVLDSPKWFNLYPVTQAQHDEWIDWAKKYIKTITKFSKKFIENQWGIIYLDCAPNVIKE